MPVFQRPFAWTEEEAAQLVDDILTAHHHSRHQSEDEGYFFLGQIIVSRKSPNAPYEVIDGQQRLVTLSCILAVLRDLVPSGEFRDNLQAYIQRPENAAQHLRRKPRVSLRPIDQNEYDCWITADGSTSSTPQSADTDGTERLREVLIRVKADIGTPQAENLQDLATYVLNHCYVVMISAGSAYDGYRLFRSVNARGQPLTDLDIARGEFIRMYQEDPIEGPKLSEAWSLIEDQIGIDQLSSYIKSIISLIHPESESQSMRDALNGILRHPSKSLVFVETLKKFVEIFEQLENCELDFGESNEILNRVVACVQALPFDDWTPAALMWLATNKSERETLEFFRALDALGLGLLVNGATSNTIAKRMREVVKRIVDGNCLHDPKSELFLTETEKDKIRDRLSKLIGAKSRFVRPLLLRLNAEMLDPEIPAYFPTKVTLEHILPQKPGPRSVWRQKIPDNARRTELSQMLGNFTILTSRMNPKASNSDFHKKREIIFSTKDSNVFPLTAELVEYPDWTETEIRDRHERLTGMARNILKV